MNGAELIKVFATFQMVINAHNNLQLYIVRNYEHFSTLIL